MEPSISGISQSYLRRNPSSKRTPFGPAHVQKLGRLLPVENPSSIASYIGLQQLLRNSIRQ